MELQLYAILDDVITLAMKMSKQHKRGSSRVNKPYTSFASSFYISKRITKPEKKKDLTKVKVVKKREKKVENSQPLTKGHDIKCLNCLRLGHIASQCPNKKVMIICESVEEVAREDELDLEVEVEKK